MENVNPLVSVIMPVYNTAPEYLEEACQSILGQSFPDLELVIIDDGSTKRETIDCIGRLVVLDKVKVIRNITNRGIPYSLNCAINESSGIYIARMDSDDIAFPKRLEMQVKYMCNHPEVCLTATRMIYFWNDPNGKETYRYLKKSDPKINDIRMLYENVGYPHPTWMIRSSFLQESNISYRDTYSEDYAFLTDCILAGGRMCLIDEVLLKYRISDAQFSKVEFDKHSDAQCEISYYRIRNTFCSLTDDECKAISQFGCKKTDYDSKVYISGIQKIMIENRYKKVFDSRLLKKELLYAWYHKYKEIFKENHPCKQVLIYTIIAIINVFPRLLREKVISACQRKSI